MPIMRPLWKARERGMKEGFALIAMLAAAMLLLGLLMIAFALKGHARKRLIEHGHSSTFAVE
jgi:hypothetical protein